jgi:hypothetical protein
MKWNRSFRLFLVIGISVVVTACGGGGSSMQSSSTTPTVAQLSGSYAFSANGSDPADGSYFVAGSFTADGKGAISGIEDLNLGSGVDSQVPFTGTYQVDSGGNVLATLSDGTGTPTVMTFPIPGGTSKATLSYNGTATGGVQVQNTTGFSNVGNFTFTVSGEGEGTVTASGSFTTAPSGGITTGAENYKDGGYTRNSSTLRGQLGPQLKGGRGIAVIGADIFSYYVVSQNQILLAGLEEATLLFGSATKQ